MTRLVRSGLVVAAWLVAPLAAAEPTVEVLAPRAEQKLADRVSAELGALGFDARTGPNDDAGDLVALARARGVVAVVRFTKRDGVLDVTVAERATGKTVSRSIEVTAADSPATLALRTVELLRASLLEMALPSAKGDVAGDEVVSLQKTVAPPAAAGDTQAPRPAPAPTPLPSRSAGAPDDEPFLRFAIELGVALEGSPNGLSPFLALTGSAGAIFDDRLRLALTTSGSLSAATTSLDGADVALRLVSLGVGARYDLVGGPLRPSVGGSAEILSTSVEVTPRSETFVYRADSEIAFAAGGHLGGAWVPNDFFALRADFAAIGITRPTIAPTSRDGSTVTPLVTFGPVLLSGGLLVESRLP